MAAGARRADRGRPGPASRLRRLGAACSIFAVGGAGILLALRIADRADQRGALIVILVGALLMRLAPPVRRALPLDRHLPLRLGRARPGRRHQSLSLHADRARVSAPARRGDLPQHQSRRLRGDHLPAGGAGDLPRRDAPRRERRGDEARPAGIRGRDGRRCCSALLHRLGSPPTRVVAYAWHPLPIWEIAGSGHVDVAMCALLMAGLLLFLHGRTLLAGVAVTLGALVKPTALLALPVFWRPWNWRLPLVVVLTAVLAYLPYLSVGSGVLGYLWGYVEEEGLASGRGFNVLWLMERFTGPMPGAVPRLRRDRGRSS